MWLRRACSFGGDDFVISKEMGHEVDDALR